MAVLWEAAAGGARVLRVFDDSPCPAVPAAVAGMPVTEIGPYCFAERGGRGHPGGTLWPAGADAGGALHPACGDFVEEVTLPGSVTTLHSAAFYNCHRLRQVAVGAGLTALGSDLFTNCRALTTLAVNAEPGDASGLKKLVGAVSADVCAVFTLGAGAALFYPEYFETLDENAPAHIFNRSIEGEGYRLRQCFTAEGRVDYPAYDAAFAQLTVGEGAMGCCRMALGRLLQPYGLSEGAADEYTFYLNAHPDDAFALAVRARDAGALRLLAALRLPTAAAARLCGDAGWSEGAAILLGHGHKAAKTYDF